MPDKIEEEEAGLSLLNIGGGACEELFGEELDKVVENILDPNMEPTAVREIILKVKFKPEHSRTKSAVTITCVAKLGPARGYTTSIFAGKNGDGNNKIYEHNPDQMRMQFESFIKRPQIQTIKEGTHA